MYIHKQTTTPGTEISLGYTFKRLQFPVRLAFAMTISKSQGATLGKVFVDEFFEMSQVGLILTKGLFSHGQLYVALSRVRNANSIKVYIQKDEKDDFFRPKTRLRNIVYRKMITKDVEKVAMKDVVGTEKCQIKPQEVRDKAAQDAVEWIAEGRTLNWKPE